MKQPVGVWIVVAVILVAAALVVTLSLASPGGNKAASPQASSSGPVIVAGAGPVDGKEEALSPVAGKTDGFLFLDMIPLGHKAPDFSATDADGKPLKLSSYLGKKNVVLVFYQGSFCTVCGAQLQNLQKHLADFKAQDAEIIAISSDDALHSQQTVGEHGLSFRVVPDARNDIIRKYGVVNINKPLHSADTYLAWPAVYVIDKKGAVQLSFAARDGHRLHSNEILPVLSKLTHKPTPFLMNYND